MRPLPVSVRWAVLAALMLGTSTGCVSVDAEDTGPGPTRSAGADGKAEERESGVSGTTGRSGSGGGGTGRRPADRDRDGKPGPKRSGDPASPSPSGIPQGPGLPSPSGSGAAPAVRPGTASGSVGEPGGTVAPATPDPTLPPVVDPDPGGAAGGSGEPEVPTTVPEEPAPPSASPAAQLRMDAMSVGERLAVSRAPKPSPQVGRA